MSTRKSEDDTDVPFDGDPGWRVTRALTDGSVVTIRPIAEDDKEGLRAALRETSPQTRYLRFFGLIGEPSEETLTYLTRVDQKNHVALVATMVTPDLKVERGIGVARYIRLEAEPETAEAAVTVIDARGSASGAAGSMSTWAHDSPSRGIE